LSLRKYIWGKVCLRLLNIVSICLPALVDTSNFVGIKPNVVGNKLIYLLVFIIPQSDSSQRKEDTIFIPKINFLIFWDIVINFIWNIKLFKAYLAGIIFLLSYKVNIIQCPFFALLIIYISYIKNYIRTLFKFKLF